MTDPFAMSQEERDLRYVLGRIDPKTKNPLMRARREATKQQLAEILQGRKMVLQAEDRKLKMEQAQRSQEQHDLTTTLRSTTLQDAQLAADANKAVRAEKSSVPQWSPGGGMNYSADAGSLALEAKTTPLAHRNLVTWGRYVAQGRAYKKGRAGQISAEASSANNSWLERKHDEYLAMLHAGETVSKAAGRSSGYSSFGNPFSSGGVSEGGFADWLNRTEKVNPLFASSWLRHRLAERHRAGQGASPINLKLSIGGDGTNHNPSSGEPFDPEFYKKRRFKIRARQSKGWKQKWTPGYY